MKFIAFACAAAALVGSSLPSLAQSNNQVGTLVCSYGPTVGMIVGSRQALACVFHRSNGDTEAYSGRFTRLGLDIGVVSAGKMGWTVLTKTRGVAPRALAGTYVGAAADASFGFGAGGNVLVGGSQRTLTLQPVSLDLQTGANLAVGVGKLELR